MKVLFGLFALNLSLFVYGAIDIEWESFSDPIIMNPSFEKKFPKLPLFGEAKGLAKYWSGSYWPLREGNINVRWNSPFQEGFNLDSPAKEQVLRMSQSELATLSPTEKYDLFTGKYDYPLRKFVEGFANSRAKDWEGICNGWAGASINHNEPTPKIMTNPDGVKIPFGSADIKALLSFYYANGFKIENTHQMGMRCPSGPFLNMNPVCNQDMNAGAFHIILANMIGINGESFLVDVDRFKEVWNHPVRGYSSQVIGNYRPRMDSAPNTERVVRLKTNFKYVDESVNSWFPLIGSEEQIIQTYEYEYELDLDENDNIIGGKWYSKDRPDFLWVVNKQVEFKGLFSRLSELLNDN